MARIAVEPFRAPEPKRSELVAQYGEDVIAAVEADITDEHDLLLKGDPDAPEPVGIFHASQSVKPKRAHS